MHSSSENLQPGGLFLPRMLLKKSAFLWFSVLSYLFAKLSSLDIFFLWFLIRLGFIVYGAEDNQEKPACFERVSYHKWNAEVGRPTRTIFLSFHIAFCMPDF
jgi:hypothetical protein